MQLYYLLKGSEATAYNVVMWFMSLTSSNVLLFNPVRFYAAFDSLEQQMTNFNFIIHRIQITEAVY